jgi:hypothetical protein
MARTLHDVPKVDPRCRHRRLPANEVRMLANDQRGSSSPANPACEDGEDENDDDEGRVA